MSPPQIFIPVGDSRQDRTYRYDQSLERKTERLLKRLFVSMLFSLAILLRPSSAVHLTKRSHQCFQMLDSCPPITFLTKRNVDWSICHSKRLKTPQTFHSASWNSRIDKRFMLQLAVVLRCSNPRLECNRTRWNSANFPSSSFWSIAKLKDSRWPMLCFRRENRTITHRECWCLSYWYAQFVNHFRHASESKCYPDQSDLRFFQTTNCGHVQGDRITDRKSWTVEYWPQSKAVRPCLLVERNCNF